MPPSARTPQAENVIAANIARRHMSKGQQAMAWRWCTQNRKRRPTAKSRTVLACSTDLALAVLAGTKALDAAYGEAKKAKQQLDGKSLVKSGRAANSLRKRSAGDHNHEDPGAKNTEPADTPEVIRDRAYTWQAGEALRLAHENELAPVNPKVVIRAAKAEITETHVKAAREVAQAWDHLANQLERLRGNCGSPAGVPLSVGAS